MNSILNNSELRRELGLRMEKSRLAMDIEKARLSSYHKYVDGSLDKPILNHMTVDEGEKDEV